MILDGGKYKIVHNGYGSFSVSDCTVENALALLNAHLDNLGDHITVVVDAIRDKTRYMVNSSVAVAALTELLSAKVGDELPKVTRIIYGKVDPEKPVETIIFEADHLVKVMAWAQENGVAWTNLKDLTSRASYDLGKMKPESLFLFDGIYKRAGKLDPMFVDSETLEMADELASLQRNKWKDTARESSVVQKYLTFITENLMHRDEKYDLGSYDGGAA